MGGATARIFEKTQKNRVIQRSTTIKMREAHALCVKFTHIQASEGKPQTSFAVVGCRLKVPSCRLRYRGAPASRVALYSRPSASPAGRTKIAHRFIGGWRSAGLGQSRQGRKTSAVPGGTYPWAGPVPTDKSVGYFLPPCRAERQLQRKRPQCVVYLAYNDPCEVRSFQSARKRSPAYLNLAQPHPAAP